MPSSGGPSAVHSAERSASDSVDGAGPSAIAASMPAPAPPLTPVPAFMPVAALGVGDVPFDVDEVDAVDAVELEPPPVPFVSLPLTSINPPSASARMPPPMPAIAAGERPCLRDALLPDERSRLEPRSSSSRSDVRPPPRDALVAFSGGAPRDGGTYCGPRELVAADAGAGTARVGTPAAPIPAPAARDEPGTRDGSADGAGATPTVTTAPHAPQVNR